MKSTALVLLSGGMDSATLAYYMRARGTTVDLLAADYGQRHRDRELNAAREIAASIGRPLDIIDLKGLGPLIASSALLDPDEPVPHGHYAEPTMLKTVVPNRNVIFLSVAFAVASARGLDYVATAVHAGDHFIYPDCRPSFLQKFAEMEYEALDSLHRPVLDCPFSEMTKAQIAALGIGLGVPYALTYSCYEGGPVHCGECGTCIERKEAFRDAGAEDPTNYVVA